MPLHWDPPRSDHVDRDAEGGDAEMKHFARDIDELTCRRAFMPGNARRTKSEGLFTKKSSICK
ncbi:MAG: hypothetical protein WCC69_11115 [Pirellulales bacterium]